VTVGANGVMIGRAAVPPVAMGPAVPARVRGRKGGGDSVTVEFTLIQSRTSSRRRVAARLGWP
jgi:hypothetical protein